VLAGIEAARKATPPDPVEHWAVADRYAGIERAALVVVNVRGERERESAERLVSDVVRLRNDQDPFRDLLSRRDRRVTAVAANVCERGDPGAEEGAGAGSTRSEVLHRLTRTESMSEYQYYEFMAVHRPLDERQLAELRALSTRARIPATSFVNTYQWGNFRGDPSTLMERYFDAFLYLANWNTRELMIRLPRRLLDVETATRYCPADSASAWAAGDHVIVSFTSEEEGDYEEDGEGWLASIIPIRAAVAAGDLRALYLGWLLCAQTDQLEDEDVEPPVPANLTRLTASLRSLIDFLHIDEDLVAVAATASPEAGTDHGSDEELVRCIDDLPVAEKNALLLRAARGDGAHLRAELLRRVGPAANGGATPREGRRAVAQLLAAAEARREERKRRATEQKARERARRDREAAIAYRPQHPLFAAVRRLPVRADRRSPG